jgi:hypothetical protein
VWGKFCAKYRQRNGLDRRARRGFGGGALGCGTGPLLDDEKSFSVRRRESVSPMIPPPAKSAIKRRISILSDRLPIYLIDFKEIFPQAISFVALAEGPNQGVLP